MKLYLVVKNSPLSMIFTSLLLSIFLLFAGSGARAQKIPDRPQPPRLVNDYAGVLSDQEKKDLEKILVDYDDSTSNQIAIVLIKSLEDYPIEEYAHTLFNQWGIGNKKTNNGILILAAIEDRKIRIETGYGLEGAVPDIIANHIIQEDIGPNFRSGDYFTGLKNASASLIKAAAGEYQPPEGYGNRKKNDGKGIGTFIFVAIIILIILANINRRGGGGFMSRRGYRGFGPTVFWPGGWTGGGGGGGGGWSGGGGGFGGFGGGSSGGGGASGSW